MLLFDHQIISVDELTQLDLDQFCRDGRAVYGIIRLQIGTYQKASNMVSNILGLSLISG